MNIKAKITSKGQITLPKQLRDDLGLGTGDTVTFARKNDGSYAIENGKKHKGAPLESLFGMIKTDIRLTDDEIKQAIGDAAIGRFERSMKE